MESIKCTLHKLFPNKSTCKTSSILKLMMLFLFTFQGMYEANAQNDFRQAANNSGGGLGVVSWINGIVQQNNSQYYEGMSVPQRIIFLNLSGSSHSLKLSHQSTKSSDNHAYDFITSWPQAVMTAGIYTSSINLLNTMNDCGAAGQANFLSACSAVHSSSAYYLDIPVPVNLFPNVLGDDVNARAAEYASNFNTRVVRVRANAPITGGTMVFNGYTGNDNDANYTINWTSTAQSVVIEFATHIANSVDPIITTMGYGNGRGAGSINGGPYHVNLSQLDGASLGSQDNQLSGGDILQVVPPVCNVGGPLVTCASTTSVQFTGTLENGGTNPTYQFTLTNNTANASITGSSSGTYTGGVSLTVSPASGMGFTPGGSVTVNFIVSRNGFVITQCSRTLSINALPDAFGQSLFQCEQDAGTATFNLTSLSSSINNGTGNPVTFYTASNLDPTTLVATPGTFVSNSVTVYARVLNSVTGCVNIAPITLTVTPKPNCSITGTAKACSGAEGLVYSSVLEGQASYKWVVTGGTITKGQTTSQITVTAGGAGTMNVQLTLTSNNNCSNTCSVNVNLVANPLAPTLGQINPTCTVATGCITVSNVDATYTYSLDIGAFVAYPPNGWCGLIAGTTHTVTAKNAAGCTSAPTSVTVNAQPATPSAPTATVTQPTCLVATGTITVTSGTAGLTFSIDGTTYTNTSGIFTGVAAGTYSLTARNAAGCTSAPTSVTVNTQPTCVFCSYTQGYWGNKNGLNTLNTSGILNAPLVIGGAGPNTITITSADISKLNNSMPGGGNSGPLANAGACNISNACFDANLTKQLRINNNLLSQTIALSLNARLGTTLNDVPILSGCLLTSAGSFSIDESVASYLKCKNTATVLGLLSLANAVLGGSLTPGQVTRGCTVPSYSAITSAVDAINNAFDECKNYIGYGACPPSRTSNTEVSTTKDEISSFVKVKVSPNPYHDNVTFNIESNISGKAILEIFNLTGQKLNTVFEGNVSAGKGQNIRFIIPEQRRSSLIYRLRVGEKTTTGKILYMN